MNAVFLYFTCKIHHWFWSEARATLRFQGFACDLFIYYKDNILSIFEMRKYNNSTETYLATFSCYYKRSFKKLLCTQKIIITDKLKISMLDFFAQLLRNILTLYVNLNKNWCLELFSSSYETGSHHNLILLCFLLIFFQHNAWISY